MSPVLALDTSVVVPLVVATHPEHLTAMRWRRRRACAVSGHALAESYSVLTRLPHELRVSASEVVHVLDSLFDEPLALSAATARRLPELLAQASITGGSVYDALVGLAARDNEMVLATRDVKARRTYERLGVEVELVA